ncbi:PilZ domain-containing protein [Marinobacter salicampi]|uniref:PilZ domain-containing protein n=1 Tax=Marinobacter salicampi TaxID=435907 RepID=UPI0014080DEB|nr:PilZ domain-containing protein [Marinobacter salicampi]
MNQDDYSFGRERPAVDEDQRSEFRLAGRATIVIELEAPDPEEQGLDSGVRMICQTDDLSVNGLRIRTPKPLIVGAWLPIEITLAENGGPYPLASEVIWCEQRKERDWLVGMKILVTEEGAYIDWVDAVSRAMTED